MRDDNKDSEAADSCWVPYGNGYEMTQSRQIITDRLRELKLRRGSLVLVHPKYQSGPSVLIGLKEGRLLIDKPRDWPGTENKIRVVFRDRSRLWNHFNCTVEATSSDTLYVSIPTRFFLLQRRNHYRVDAPSGSLASFVHKKILYAEIPINDLSAGGMLMISSQHIPLERGAILEEIMLSMPMEDDPIPVILHCRRGSILRERLDRQGQLYFFGVGFEATKPQEEAIIRYVRQRELELLRKPVNNTD